jgi:type I restriction enzyme M protein
MVNKAWSYAHVLRDAGLAFNSSQQITFLLFLKMADVGGRCAIVVPDNVLFEGGAGETVRRRLLRQCEVHTLLRLPAGIWYSPGVKANVLFFDKKPGREEAWTRELLVYDLRTNTHFALKKDPLRRHDLDEFVSLYKPENRHERTTTWTEENPESRWRRYAYEEILRREGATWTYPGSGTKASKTQPISKTLTP